MKKILYTGIAACLLVACTKDRDFPDVKTPHNVVEGDIVINEYSASGSTFADEFGYTGDWIELYNTTPDTIFIVPNKWYISDDATDPYKYVIQKDTFITPAGHFVLFADKLDTNITTTYIHANFNLSAAGEEIILTALNNQNIEVELDSRTFGAQTSGKSEGRSPDGSNNWAVFNVPTPGTANQ